MKSNSMKLNFLFDVEIRKKITLALISSGLLLVGLGLGLNNSILFSFGFLSTTAGLGSAIGFANSLGLFKLLPSSKLLLDKNNDLSIKNNFLKPKVSMNRLTNIFLSEDMESGVYADDSNYIKVNGKNHNELLLKHIKTQELYPTHKIESYEAFTTLNQITSSFFFCAVSTAMYIGLGSNSHFLFKLAFLIAFIYAAQRIYKSCLAKY